MKMKLIIASGDSSYAEQLSRVLADRYESTLEVSVCLTQAQWEEHLRGGRFDAALLEAPFAQGRDLSAIPLPFLLQDEFVPVPPDCAHLRKINKYQRISSIAGSVLEHYAQLSSGAVEPGKARAQVVCVWSPAGGTGKTSVALAYAARKASDGRHVTYLDLENFCSVPAYFPASQGVKKSISGVFEKLESNVPMLLKGILQQDSGSGIAYFCGPDNYDDMNILTAQDLEVLIQACALDTQELVIDLSEPCDERTQKVFELSDRIFLVCDASPGAQAKLRQFASQHNVLQRVERKCVLVNNKGARITLDQVPRTICLPLVRTQDVISVYKTLSGNSFEPEASAKKSL